MPTSTSTAKLRIGAGVSGHLDPAMAAEYAVNRCAESMAAQLATSATANGGGAAPAQSATTKADMAVVFISMHHADAAGAIAHIIRKKLDPTVLIGCTAEAVVGGEIEMENSPGVSIFAASMPGVNVHAFSTEDIPLPRTEDVTPAEIELATQAAGMKTDHRATILLADPFSVPLLPLLPLLAKARNHVTGHTPDPNYAGSLLRRTSPIIGGLASAASKPGANVLLLNDRLLRSGGVGLTLSGKIRVDSLVSQGCRPIGPTMVVTGCKGQMLTSLGGRPALEALEEILDSLGPAMRERLRRGLFIGRAVNEYKDRFGRDDFLIRTVIGVDKEHKAIAVADLLRVGQTVQFHVRDALTAAEDLGLLLDLQKLYGPPAGALLFTCNGRGTRLFDKPHHDTSAFARAFAPPPTAEQQSRGGIPMGPAPTAPTPGSSSIPLAGFFCAGEIGPVGDQVFVHGQTACAALFRPMA